MTIADAHKEAVLVYTQPGSAVQFIRPAQNARLARLNRGRRRRTIKRLLPILGHENRRFVHKFILNRKNAHCREYFLFVSFAQCCEYDLMGNSRPSWSAATLRRFPDRRISFPSAIVGKDLRQIVLIDNCFMKLTNEPCLSTADTMPHKLSDGSFCNENNVRPGLPLAHPSL